MWFGVYRVKRGKWLSKCAEGRLDSSITILLRNSTTSTTPGSLHWPFLYPIRSVLLVWWWTD